MDEQHMPRAIGSAAPSTQDQEPADEAPAQQRVRPRLPPGRGRDRLQLQGPGRLHPAARAGARAAGKHRHPAGVDGRLDCAVRQRAHPGHRTRRRRPAPVHLPPGLAREEGPAQVRPLTPARRNPARRAPAGHHGPALRGTHPGAGAGRRLQDAGQRLAAGRLRALHQRKRQPRPRHPALRPRAACARTRSGSASRPRAARPGNRGSTTPTSPPSCASSSAAAATPACWPTRTAGAGTR